MANLIDSDYDEDDEELNSEMDEIFSISPHHSDDYCDRHYEDSENDSDDLDPNQSNGKNEAEYRFACSGNQLQNFYNKCICQILITFIYRLEDN